MLKIPIIVVIFGGIPECIAMVILFYLLLSEELKWKLIVALGTGTAFLTYFIRLLPVRLYEHTFYLMAVTIVALRILTKRNIMLIITCVVLGASLSLFDDGVIMLIIYKMNLINLVEQSPVIRLLLGYLETTVLILVCFILSRYLKKGVPWLLFKDKEHSF